MGGLIWIASYPKSGNTWTRNFLHNLLHILQGRGGAPQDINRMSRFTTWEIAAAWYRPLLGGRTPAEAGKAEIAAVRPAAQEAIARATDSLIFVKTHNALVIDRGVPTVNGRVTAGAIYIVRNPLDVAISFSHHRGCDLDTAIAEMAEERMETRASTRAVHEVYGSWSVHVESWTRKPMRGLHVLRYEDLLASPREAFGSLVRFLLQKPTLAQLDLAIERSSFGRLQAQENAVGFVEKPKHAQRFFREGKVGQWREVLTPAQVQRIVERHRTQMARFNYLPDEYGA